MKTRILTSVRLSPDAKRLLATTAEKLAISQAAVVELAIREKAKREGVK
jgi:predicted transcriptional regulator